MTDLWKGAPGAWQPLTTSERQTWPEASRAPLIWAHVTAQADRDLVAALAVEVIHADGAFNRQSFGGRLLERLRARQAEAKADAERRRLLALDRLLSQHLTSLADLGYRVAARGDLLASLRTQRDGLDAMIRRLEGAATAEPAGRGR